MTNLLTQERPQQTQSLTSSGSYAPLGAATAIPIIPTTIASTRPERRIVSIVEHNEEDERRGFGRTGDAWSRAGYIAVLLYLQG